MARYLLQTYLKLTIRPRNALSGCAGVPACWSGEEEGILRMLEE
ncbi:MAG: hypothetical protein ACI30J_07540 [Paludibacteraceae bacterium]